jgi:phosphoglycerate dehydrogenase-like enzyme
MLGVERMFGPDLLHEALAAGDFVVLAVPLTHDTRGLIGPRELEAMKRSAFLINVSRGKVVQEAALVLALKAGQIAGAALDVFEEEPLSPESELWNMENAILSPHVSSWSTDYRPRAAAIFTENVERYLAGQPLLHRIDRARGY